MAENDQKQSDRGWHYRDVGELDQQLDAALVKFAAVEPRAGLEQRVLARLRTEREHVRDHSWWRWGLVAAVAAVVIVTIALARRPGKPSHPVLVSHPSPATQSPERFGPRDVANGVRPHDRRRPRKTGHRAQPSIVVAGGPKFDQFPSPQPLSEQERILATYVAEYPEHAVLVARARAEALRQDQEEEMRQSGAAHDNDLQQRNQ
jgi:hypothetical protein